MAGPDAVPEADRQEQEAPAQRDEVEERPVPVEASDADVFEQELPLAVSDDAGGIDAERVEPVSDGDWTEG